MSLTSPAAPLGPRSQGETALVFGREESGLSEAEIRLCSHACALPTSQVSGSMNLSHAVAVVLSWCYQQRLEVVEATCGVQSGYPSSPDASLLPATSTEVEVLLDKFKRIAIGVGFSAEETAGAGSAGNHGRKRLPLGHLRALLSRSRCTTGEVRSLHGFASAILNLLDNEGVPEQTLD